MAKDETPETDTSSWRTLAWNARYRLTSTSLVLLAAVACGNKAEISDTSGLTGSGAATGVGGAGGSGGSGGSSADGSGGTEMMTEMGGNGGTAVIKVPDGTEMMPDKCPPTTCMEEGYACGSIVDACGTVTNCADEGLKCGPLEACSGGLDTPAQCVVGNGEPCELCASVEDCSAADQPTTITGRVVTPGRTDANTANQLGVPNAFVYILRNKGVDDLPPIPAGIPEGGTSCDRCEDQDLGPVLVGTVTDATGSFKLEGNVPVGDEFTMVVKAGRFRRAFNYTVPTSAACQITALPTALPENPARLPRSMKDGLAVNIPRIAVSTGSVDAMECVLEKMGIAHEEFANPGAAGDAAARIHMYQGHSNNGKPNGASIDTSTPLEDALYGDAARLKSYDIILADCEGQDADSSAGPAPDGNLQYAERDAHGANVMDYVNRGGRMFASHLRYAWLYRNGTQAFDADAPFATGLDAAATWEFGPKQNVATGTGVVSVTRPQASPRIQAFADWMDNESVAEAPDYGFEIAEPRSQAAGLGESSEEFVYTTSVSNANMMATTGDKIQQFSFNTPYAATDDAVCGRVAYSGFHVSVGNTSGVVFPNVCGTGDLTKQEKVLLYMLFDLAACVGEPPDQPVCVPQTCEELELKCGFSGDGCGKALDCGPCKLPGVK